MEDLIVKVGEMNESISWLVLATITILVTLGIMMVAFIASVVYTIRNGVDENQDVMTNDECIRILNSTKNNEWKTTEDIEAASVLYIEASRLLRVRIEASIDELCQEDSQEK